MSTKEEKLTALYLEYKKKEQEICKEYGMGIDNFKDELWKSLRVKVASIAVLQASSWITTQFTQHIADQIDGEGVYDFLFCIKKIKESGIKDSVNETMREAERKRKDLTAAFQKDMNKIEAEELNICTKQFEEDMKEIEQIHYEQDIGASH